MNWSQNYNCWKCFCHSSIALQRGRWRKGRRGGKLEVAGRRTRKEERRLLRPVTLLPPPEGCKPAKRSGTSASTTPGSSPTILPQSDLSFPGQWRGWVIRRTRAAQAAPEIRVTSGDRSAPTAVPLTQLTPSFKQIFCWPQNISPHHTLGISSEQISSRSTNLLKIQIWVQFPAQETRATLAAIRAPRRATAAWKKLRSGKWAHLFFSPKIQRNSINPHSFPCLSSSLHYLEQKLANELLLKFVLNWWDTSKKKFKLQ